MGTPQKGNGDHKNRSAAGGRDRGWRELSHVDADIFCSFDDPLVPSLDLILLFPILSFRLQGWKKHS